MKTGKEFYELLSHKEKKEFKENVIDFNFEMERTDFSMYDFISGAFVWNKTKQGHEYWSNLAIK